MGQEEGGIIQPDVFDLGGGGLFVVPDVPRGGEGIQIFGPAALRTGGFFIAGRAVAQVILGSLAVTGISSLQYSGNSVFISEPARGALITEYSPSGIAQRTIGRLRDTGYERDRSRT